MKKIIIFGSLFAVFLIMLMPALSAIEVNMVKDANEEYIENLKIMPGLFRGRFTGIIGKLASFIALPIVISILTIFGSALTAATSLAIPILNLFVKMVGLLYGNIFGLTTNTFRALLVCAILLLF